MPLLVPFALRIDSQEKLDEGSLALMFGSRELRQLPESTYVRSFRCDPCRDDKVPAMTPNSLSLWTFNGCQKPERNVAHAADDRSTPHSLVAAIRLNAHDRMLSIKPRPPTYWLTQILSLIRLIKRLSD